MNPVPVQHDRESWVELIDLERLTIWMDSRGLEVGLPITAASTLSGGTQNILLRFTRGERDFVLRRPPRRLRAESNEVMRREMKVLAALAGSSVPHPGFIAGEVDPELLGACFYLMEPVVGFNPTQGLPEYHQADPAARREMGNEMVDAIVALSRIEPGSVGLSDLGKLEGWIERQVPRWRSQLESYAQFDGWTGIEALPAVEAICTWLESNRPRTMQAGLIHGDFHLANVLFENDSPKIAAVVDWELASRGDPLLDLGWLTATWYDPAEEVHRVPVTPWEGFPSLEEVVDRYLSATGRSAIEARWYSVLAPFKLGAILEGSHARACAGLAPTPIGEQLHAHAISLFERALRRIERPII